MVKYVLVAVAAAMTLAGSGAAYGAQEQCGIACIGGSSNPCDVGSHSQLCSLCLFEGSDLEQCFWDTVIKIEQ